MPQGLDLVRASEVALHELGRIVRNQPHHDEDPNGDDDQRRDRGSQPAEQELFHRRAASLCERASASPSALGRKGK
jgi:hypothetical protein